MFPQIVMTVKGVALLVAAVYAFAALLRKDDAQWVKGAPLYIFVGMYVIGMWGHIIWVPYLALVMIIPLLARSRPEAAALYVIAIVSVPIMGYKIAIGSIYLFAVGKYLFCALGLLFAYWLRKGSTPSGLSRFDLPFLIFLILETSQARDPTLTNTLRQLVPVIFAIGMPYFLMSRSLNTPEDVRRFVLAIALAGFVMAAVAIIEARLHWLVYKQIDSNLNIEAFINPYGKMRGGVIRAPASFAESTSLGVFLAIAGVAVLGIRSSFSSHRNYLIALGLIGLGLTAANSRNAFIGIALGLLAFDFYRRRYGPLAIKLGVGAALYLIALMAAQFSPYVATMIGRGEGTQGSTDYRMALLTRGMEEIRKNPVIGTNLKNALENLEDLRQGEHIIDLVNGYITYGLTLGYTGIIGLLLFFISLCVAMFAAKRALARNVIVGDIAGFVFATSASMIVISFFTGFGGQNSTPFYMVCALGASLWSIRRMAAAGDGGEKANLGQVQPLSNIQAIIAADRAAARHPNESARHPA